MEDESTISQQYAGSPTTDLTVSKTAKQRGELAELAFMHKAARLGFGVAKPWGDSERFDFILSYRKQLWRVQVKSTYGLHRTAYRVMSQGTRLLSTYTPDEIDFLVAYLVPREVYYVIPAVAVQGLTALYLYPSGTRKGAGQFEKYREAWHLMRPEEGPNV